jgi:ubiquinone/menaquinone biosynthesis C-methylase UbiE
MSNIDFFDELALKSNSYMNTARMFSLNFNVYQDTFNDIDKKMEFRPQDIVLDLGGGCGQITKYIARRCEKVILADGAKEAVKFAENNLKNYHNVGYSIFDITDFPLPFSDYKFDKIICYSVVHYLRNYGQFEKLLKELLRISKAGGKILIGDVPLVEKYQLNLDRRAQKPVKNFLLNSRYRIKKFFTKLFYSFQGIAVPQIAGMKYDKESIRKIVASAGISEFQFLIQNPCLPAADSREDLLIIKS